MAGDRAWFSYVNRALTATVTTDSEETSLPVTNTQNRLSYKIWRTQADTAKLQYDFGSSVTWQAIVLQFIAHRDPASTADDEIAATDQITIAGSDVAIGDSELYSQTVGANVLRERGYFAHVAASEITSRYLELTITATSRAAAGYFNLGFAHVGPLFQPDMNYNVGSVLDFGEDSLVNLSTTGGSAFVESRQRLLGFEGTWGLIDQTERANWQAMQEKTGVTSPVAFGVTTTISSGREAFIARFGNAIRFSAGQNRRVSARVSLLENR